MKKKHPSRRVLRILLIVAAVFVLLIAAVAVAGYFITENNSTDLPTEPVLADEPVEYIDVPFSTELKLFGEETEIPIRLSEEACADLLAMVREPDSVFRFAEYYGLEPVYERYRNTTVEKSTENDLLTNGSVDTDKLYQTALRNNAAAVADGKNTLNPFYVSLEDEKIAEICQVIAEVVNHNADKLDMEKVANTLERLTVFKRNGGSASAYVSTEIAFVYIPAVVNLYEQMQTIAGGEPDSTEKQVMVHETLHLIQFGSNDGNDENGIEVGCLRQFNLPNEEKTYPVDALYFSWIAEAGAELAMAEYLGIEPQTYQKKISYATSCNLSRFYDMASESQRIEWLSFRHTLEEVFDALGLATEGSQMEFLKLLFSIEVTQTDATDFLEYYQEQTGLTLTEKEQTGLRMDVRTDAVEYLTRIFFENLIRAVGDGAVSDLDTAFFLLRLWELDTFNHLRYTEKTGLEHAEDFILWYDRMQTGLLTAVAESSGLDPAQMQSLYDAYTLQTETADGEVKARCDLAALSADAQTFIAAHLQDYTLTTFSRIHDVAQFLEG